MCEQRLDDVCFVLKVVRGQSEGEGGLWPNVVVWTCFTAL